MAQGALKKITKPAASSSKRGAAGPKKGARVIAPRRTNLVKQHKLAKKLSAGLVGKTERNLAHKAGHLELLKGTRKDKKAEKANQKTGGNN